MPDFAALDQQLMLAQALWFLPAPARGPVAEGLFELGVRVHPELATKQILTSGAPGLANHSPRRLVSIKSQEEGMDFLRQFKPDMAAKIDAAKTPADQQEARDEIAARAPEVIAHAQRQAEQYAAEQTDDAS